MSGRSRCGSRRKLGLGVNERTGRLQWCPGFTCCKLLLVLPVVMLPLTLVLVLLMRVDSMLMALRVQRQQLQQHQHQHQQQLPFMSDAYEDDSTDNNNNNNNIVALSPFDDIYNEEEELLAPFEVRRLNDAERSRRCMSFKYGLGENLDMDERNIMKDARTSFLPQDTTMWPRECLESAGTVTSIGGGSHSGDTNDYGLDEDYLSRQTRSSYGRHDDGDVNGVNATEQWRMLVGRNDDNVATAVPEDMARLKSFGSADGTKENIRQAQARTMLKYMDASVDPCKDFYKFACGNWERHHPIPKDKAGYDTFEMLRENLDLVLKELLASPSDEYRPHSLPHVESNAYDNEQQQQEEADVDDQWSPSSLPLRMERRHVARDRWDGTMGPMSPTAAMLRQHIVRCRGVLERMLLRRRRESANSKWKRLIRAKHSQGAGSAVRQPTSPSSSSSSSAHMKAKNLYRSCIDGQLLSKRGVRPLLQLVESLGGWPALSPQSWSERHFDWLNLTAHLRRYNNDIFLVQWVGPDIQNSDEHVVQLDQTGLGLPTRDYFLLEANAKYLRAYQSFMGEVLHRLGASAARAQQTAAELIAFETQLAYITAPPEERLNVTKLYRRLTLRELHEAVPQIDWTRYLATLQQRKVAASEQVVIYAIKYMQDLVGLLAETSPSTIANYLLWRFVRHRINNVDERFDDVKQSFYHALFGREESPSRWKVCVAQVNSNMGMAVGSMFVARYFDENSKRDTLAMTHELQQAFRQVLQGADWLDATTKRLAADKVNTMSLKIGYPDFILNAAELDERYADLHIRPDEYFENTLNVLLHTARTEQRKLFEPVNKTAWQTAPAIVNAYYSRNKNQIMFPAGILQPPFYHRHFPRSLNFGGIGVVIGHELTHGFDDKGRLFDRKGNIHKWWTDESIRAFDERARCIIAQYSNYTLDDVGLALNGESTQGENIADNGGIGQAFYAYKRWLQENPSHASDEHLPGLSLNGRQLFFLNFGQVWCGAMRPEAMRNKLNTAIHSPGRFRVLGTLSNSEDFAREFQCPPGSPMNPAHKCSVW